MVSLGSSCNNILQIKHNVPLFFLQSSLHKLLHESLPSKYFVYWDIPYRIEERVLKVIYLWILLNLVNMFKSHEALWAQNKQYLHGWEQVVIIGIRVNPRPQCGILFGLVKGVYLFSLTILWYTTRMLCLHIGGRWLWHPTTDKGKKFLELYMYRVILIL